jgi:hypothetical protein
MFYLSMCHIKDKIAESLTQDHNTNNISKNVLGVGTLAHQVGVKPISHSRIDKLFSP